MIDVIGTDAGAPGSLPAAQQELIRAADRVAAPKRLQTALRQWLGSDHPELISSDDPRALATCLKALPSTAAVVVLADTIDQVSYTWTVVPFEHGADNKKPIRYI